jgi:hypothetical protein
MFTPQRGTWRRTRLCSRAGIATASVAALLGVASTAHAQRWTVVPSVSVSAVYDDNLFLTETARAAAGVRVGPGVLMRYQPSPRAIFEGRTDMLGEYFGDPQVSRLAANRTAVLTGRFRLGPKTTAALTGQYLLTSYPGELVPTAGLSYGRRSAEGMGGLFIIERQFSPKVTFRLGYGVHVVRLARETHGLSSELSGDTSFVFKVAPHTDFTFKVAPRYFHSSLNPGVGVSVEHTLERARVSLTYDRGRNLVYDRGILIESYSGRLSYRLSEALSVEASPGLYRYWEFADERRSWRVSAQVSHRVSRMLQAYAGYDYGLQDARLLTTARASVPMVSGRPLARNAIVLGLTMTPWRQEETRR